MQGLITVEGVKKTIFGAGALKELGNVARELDASRVLLVMDQALSKTAISEKAQEVLQNNGIAALLYSKVTLEPSPQLADEGAEIAKEENVGAVIGLGGGSTMDVAKAIAVLVNNGGKAVDYIGLGLVKKPGLPTIMVPTTSGTGSEATFTAVFTMRENKAKGGINSPFLYPSVAVLDPELTLGLPREITAYTGMDALTHALESYTSLQAHFMSEPVSLSAVELIAGNIREAVADGDNYGFRESMMKGSYLAGLGLAMAGVGAVHAMAYPLGAFFDVPHGVANAVMLPYVLAYNYQSAVEKFCRVGEAMGREREPGSSLNGAKGAVKAVFDLGREIGIPRSLRELGIPEDAIPDMAEAAMKVERPMLNNPKPMTVDAVEEVYSQAFEGKTDVIDRVE
ncbi:MAG: iron-containing alcohol dehydrogenase [Deltaproteobacteria bacterium]|nr:iron-containing alcohol dehydrogenase [Deltaproteobacteria bacterium]